MRFALLQALVAFGDSVTVGARRDGSVTPEQTFAALLERSLSTRVINAGIGGNTTGQMLARIDKDVLAHKPSAVLIMAGLNDAAFVDPGPVARTWPRVSLERYEANLREIVSRVRQAGATPVMLTPNPMTSRYPYANLGTYRGSDINHALSSYAAAAAGVARETESCLVDVYGAWRSGQDYEELLPDGVHPNAGGHARIARQIVESCGNTIRQSSRPGPSPR